MNSVADSFIFLIHELMYLCAWQYPFMKITWPKNTYLKNLKQLDRIRKGTFAPSDVVSDESSSYFDVYSEKSNISSQDF